MALCQSEACWIRKRCGWRKKPSIGAWPILAWPPPLSHKRPRVSSTRTLPIRWRFQLTADCSNVQPWPTLPPRFGGRRDVWFMYEQVFLKDGGAARRTPWHQDSCYLPVAGEQLMVMWISFDPVAKQGALEFVRGSHRGVLYDGSSFDPDDDTAPLYADGRMPRLPNI